MLTIKEEVLALKETTHLGPRLRRLHWVTDQMITEELTQMGLTAAQGHIIRYLCWRKQPPCAQDIAEAFQLSGATVSGLLRRLEAKEFIELRADAGDRRVRRIFVLEKAEAVHLRIREAIRAHEQRMVEGFTEEERRQFAAFLDRAIENMGGGAICCGNREE